MPVLFFAVMKNNGSLVEEVRQRVEKLGFDLVDLRRKGSARRIGIEIRMDLMDPKAAESITVDDCATVSRALEEWLDEAGVLGPNYVLEVSSPGLERPVRWPRHWVKHIGSVVNVKLPDRGRVKARIIAVDKEDVVLTIMGFKAPVVEEVRVPITDDLKARLAVDWEDI